MTGKVGKGQRSAADIADHSFTDDPLAELIRRQNAELEALRASLDASRPARARKAAAIEYFADTERPKNGRLN